MDQEFVAPRIAPRVTPMRAALGVAGAVFGGFLLSLALGAAPAHADDSPPPQPGLLTQVVSAVAAPATAIVTPVAQTVAPVVAPVAAVAAPVTTPVVATVAPVSTAVTTAVTQVSQSSPVTQITTPVTTAVDTVIAATPLKAIVGSTPTSSVLHPVTKAIDDDLAGVAPALAPIVKALDPVITVIAPPLVTIGQSLDPTQVADVLGATAATTARALEYALPVVVATAASGVASGFLNVGDSPAQSGGVPSLSPGGSASPSLLLGAFGAGLIVLLALARRRNSGDATPASPVYETDSSPD